MTATGLYEALVELCQEHGLTTTATYDHLRDAVTSLDRDHNTDNAAEGMHRAATRTVTVRVDHDLSRDEFVGVLCRWLSGMRAGDVVPPTSRADALDIIRGVLAFEGEQWEGWRDDDPDDDGQTIDTVTRRAEEWVTEFFGAPPGPQEDPPRPSADSPETA
jgi:hypothetical protein